MKKLLSITTLALALALLPALAGAKQVTLAVTRILQHKDTTMLCVANPNPCGGVAHQVNCALTGCPHCGYYCVPACVAMISQYRGGTGVQVQQDWIYDAGKMTGGEIIGNGVLETHGMGMFDVSGAAAGLPDEVRSALQWARGLAVVYSWGPVSQGRPALTPGYIIQCIDDHIPLIWCDHNGWPSGINPPPQGQVADYSGHAKIIAGYNDQGTADTSDDTYLIINPWPGAGPPSWIGQQPLLDPNDVFYADYDPVPVEQRSWGEVKRLFR